MQNKKETIPQLPVEPELLTRSEAAGLLHVSLSYIDHLTDLPCYRLGKKKLFSKAEILDFLRSNHVTPGMRKVSKTDAIKTREATNVEN